MAKTYNVSNKSEAKRFIVKLIEHKIREVAGGNKIKQINVRFDNNAKTVTKKNR